MEPKPRGTNVTCTVWARINHGARETVLQIFPSGNLKKIEEEQNSNKCSQDDWVRRRATDRHLTKHWRLLHKSLFIWNYANSIIAADATWHAVRMNMHTVSAWRCRVCPGRGSNQGKAVLPSDWPHVLCQGYLQCWYQRQATWSKSSRRLVSNSFENICPSHWTESKVSSRPYLEE